MKYNTFIAAIELVNRICDTAMYNTDESLARISWSDFVSGITETELIRYLKGRRLYINEDMGKSDILEKIPKLPVPVISHSDVQIVLRLVTVLAATHLANKVKRIIKDIDRLENPDEVMRFFK